MTVIKIPIVYGVRICKNCKFIISKDDKAYRTKAIKGISRAKYFCSKKCAYEYLKIGLFDPNNKLEKEIIESIKRNLERVIVRG